MADNKLFSNISLLGEQHKVVENIQYNILVKGESGSGKTTGFLARIHFILNQQITTSKHIINICLNEDAIALAQIQYRDMFNEDAPQLHTMFTLAYTIFMQSASNHNKVVEASSSIVQRLLFDAHGWRLRDDELAIIKQRIAYLKCNDEAHKDDTLIRGEPINALCKFYEDFKIKKKIVDEHDVVIQACHLLQENENIRAYFHELVEFIQIDDAQELTRYEHYLLQALMGEKQCIVMFSNAQAIHSASGACIDCINNFDVTYNNTLVINWEYNFTASKTCISAANHFLYNGASEILSKSEIEDEIVCKAFADIQRLYAYAKKKRQERDDIVFVYRHTAFVLPLLDSLLQDDVPFQFFGDMHVFFEDTIVKELLHYIRVLLDPKNAESFEVIYKAMDLEISDKVQKEVLALIEEDQSMDIFEALMRSSLKMVKKKELSSRMELVRMLPKKDSILIIKTILRELGYENRLAALHTNEADPYLLMIKTFAQNYPDPLKFLERMQELKCANLPQEGQIKVLPIEAVRGMSNAFIYVIDCIEELSFVQLSEERIQDSRNHYAMALTHATHLELFAFRSVYDVPCTVSKYVMNIHKKDKDNTKQVVRSTKIVRKVSETHLKPSTRIQHETLGIGSIQKVKDGMMQVNFENGEVKNLNIKHCLSNEMIKLV